MRSGAWRRRPLPTEPTPDVEEEADMNRNSRILVVDDEASVRRQLHVGLAQHGYEVEECESVVPALDRLGVSHLHRSPYGVVVLDVRLPDIDGLKALSVIRTAYPDLPVVVITGYGNQDTVNEVRSYGACSFFDKPFDTGKLADEISRFVEGPVPGYRMTTGFGPDVLSSALVFLRAGSMADLPALYSALSYAEGVCYCDAVLGDWDLVLLLQARNPAEIDRLVTKNVASRPGVGSYEVHLFEKARLSEGLEEFIWDYETARTIGECGEPEADARRDTRSSAYVVLDVEPSRLTTLFMKLYFTEDVIHCDVTDGGRRIVLFMQGVSAADVEARLREEIRPMPGVSRIGRLTVMNFAVK
jgi:CheY-like chemotaxis protein